ncbi:hypothetical protein HYH02_005355 [Chlamydomonas schloesseri]|uniref:Membrane protein insertion efficiency factor n=1 Tax=Chlamydomonas schloesseri TaxID=2026947 RepID=A0A835WLJ3_9CHLO|nr:hypothetical protein HYH02_005355 [Chlamydomonas schloesseri]|eukprot:KAG2449832.1 hypothetical protein HYH02_005355 [Chlamydomonas schloesseri]
MCKECWGTGALTKQVGPSGRGSPLVVAHPAKDRPTLQQHLHLQTACARDVSAAAAAAGGGSGSNGGGLPGAEANSGAVGPSGREAALRPRAGTGASREPDVQEAEREAEGVGAGGTPAGGSAEGGAGAEPPPSLGVRAALSMLAFYRNVMSPLMPSSCRFLPTCSNYSIESYKKFGVVKGTVLTAWRLMRCNPWGGRGYDPPAWPPVGLEGVYVLPYTPEITVVAGVWLAWWFVTSTIDSLAL